MSRIIIALSGLALGIAFIAYESKSPIDSIKVEKNVTSGRVIPSASTKENRNLTVTRRRQIDSDREEFQRIMDDQSDSSQAHHSDRHKRKTRKER